MVFNRGEHPISDALDGDVGFSSLVLNGWENNLHTWSSDGVVYLRKTASVLSVYRKISIDGSFAATDQMCAASIGSTAAADDTSMTAVNSSGISGTLTHTSGTGYAKCIISFCDESDVRLYLRQLSTALDNSSNHEGQTRFRKALLSSLRIISTHLKNQISKSGARKSNDMIDITVIANPSQYREIQAMLVTSILCRNFGGPSAIDYISYAEQMEHKALEILNRTVLELDDNDDNIIDAEIKPQVKLIRG